MNEPVDFGRLQAEKYRMDTVPRMRYRGIFWGVAISALLWLLICLIFIVAGAHAGNNWDAWQAQQNQQEMLRLQREQVYQQERMLQQMRQQQFNEDMRRLREDTTPKPPVIQPYNPRWE